MTVATVKVETASHQYPVYLFSDISKHHFENIFAGKQVVIVTQAPIFNLHSHFLSHLFNLSHVPMILLPDGEKHKNIATWQWLLDELITLKCQRNTVLVAFGGGVVGDIVGFAASTFYRGIPFIQIPTTLIAQVDSSVGGKTGVNHHHIKNAIGAFYQPKAVLIDVQILATLPQREFIAGLAEVIKYGLIADADFFGWLEKNMAFILQRDEAILLYMIERCIALKASIVGMDEQEKTGVRQLLNFGHTFGHALESYFNYEYLLHGEAVALGMWLAAELSYSMSELDQNSLLRIQSLLKGARLIKADFIMPKAPLWIGMIAADKKKMGSLYRFILLKGIGKAFPADLSSLTLINQVINRFNSSVA